ncbi:MAG: DUF4249 domain-containing protein [Bacteroidota bacterium]
MKKYCGPYCLILLLALAACKKAYEPQVIATDYHFLVIEGVINAGSNAVTTILLNRTKSLGDSSAPNPELGAQVFIEGEAGGSFQLQSQGAGMYNSAALSLNTSGKYRLRIVTSNGKIYQSDFVPAKQTPPIDSVTWKQDKGVTLYVYAHDPQNATRYYRWDYMETWLYRSPVSGSLGLNNGQIFFLDSTTQITDCWTTAPSHNIAIASTEALAQDVISNIPIAQIQQNDEKMGIRYSSNVKQYGITKEAYQYWQIIEKSSQQTGGIFDPQPSQLSGNFHCISDPNEPVIGFASMSVVTEKRIFIDYRELTGWFYSNKPGNQCDPIIIGQNANFLLYNYPDTTYIPSYFVSGGGLVIVKKVCLDCRRRGGTNSKPSFWK